VESISLTPLVDILGVNTSCDHVVSEVVTLSVCKYSMSLSVGFPNLICLAVGPSGRDRLRPRTLKHQESQRTFCVSLYLPVASCVAPSLSACLLSPLEYAWLVRRGWNHNCYTSQHIVLGAGMLPFVILIDDEPVMVECDEGMSRKEFVRRLCQHLAVAGRLDCSDGNRDFLMMRNASGSLIFKQCYTPPSDVDPLLQTNWKNSWSSRIARRLFPGS
jgi:hypothetical protein